MEQRDLEKEQLLGDIILGGGDVLSFLNDTDGLEGEGEGSGDLTTEEEGHDHEGSGDRTMEEEGHDHDGSGDRTMEEEAHDHDGSGFGDRTEEGVVAKSGEVYILIKPVLSS